MKKRTAIFSFLLVTGVNTFFPFVGNVNAEDYICADVGGEERPTYKRINNNKFISTIILDGEKSTSELSIVNETKNFIVLIQTFDYQDSWTSVLDKKNKEYSETYTSWDPGKKPEVYQSFGSCLVVD
tara:strand:- start:410 stop:790 length:381 start_codon:yes stop_codon:yes gene_type:complete